MSTDNTLEVALKVMELKKRLQNEGGKSVGEVVLLCNLVCEGVGHEAFRGAKILPVLNGFKHADNDMFKDMYEGNKLLWSMPDDVLKFFFDENTTIESLIESIVVEMEIWKAALIESVGDQKRHDSILDFYKNLSELATVSLGSAIDEPALDDFKQFLYCGLLEPPVKVTQS